MLSDLSKWENHHLVAARNETSGERWEALRQGEPVPSTERERSKNRSPVWKLDMASPHPAQKSLRLWNMSGIKAYPLWGSKGSSEGGKS